MNHGLSYTERDSALTVYCDADWGTDSEDRRSRTGIITFVGNSLISRISRRQTTTSLSSCEAEYAALLRLPAKLRGLGVSSARSESVLERLRPRCFITIGDLLHGQKDGYVA
jgi:hypothetical protein